MEQQQTNLECLRCGNTMELLGEKAFQHASAFDFDGFIVHRCPTCGKVEFFEFIVEDVECVECGATITAGQQACPACGWTWIESDE
jgi:predicted RNA-binding Zn-ribbon protein involved in translation (DUF1610 family)